MPRPLPLLDTTRSGPAAVEVPGRSATVVGPSPGRADVPAAGDAAALAYREIAGDGAEGRGAAADLLGRLRAPTSARPPVDPGLAGGLRAWLEDGACPAAAGTVTVRPGPDGSLTLTAEKLPGDPLGAPGAVRLRGDARGPGGPTGARDLRTELLRRVFRISVTTGPPRAAFEDALAALSVDEDGGPVLQAVQELSRHRRARLREAVRHAAATVTAQWGPVPAAWLPRTGERLVAPLAGGRVVLRSDADLAMGGPSAGRASVCAVRAHGGAATDDGPSRRLLALLETLRGGAAPFRVASYDLDRGRLTVDDVTDAHLCSAVRDVLAVLDRHANGTAGGR